MGESRKAGQAGRKERGERVEEIYTSQRGGKVGIRYRLRE